MSRIGNPVFENTISSLRKASKSSGADIWLAVSRYLSRPRSRKVCVNVGKVSRLTKNGDVVVIPGKVLGGGDVSHSVVVGAFLFSKAAAEKISKAGGEALTIGEFLNRYPDGRGVILIGG